MDHFFAAPLRIRVVIRVRTSVWAPYKLMNSADPVDCVQLLPSCSRAQVSRQTHEFSQQMLKHDELLLVGTARS